MKGLRTGDNHPKHAPTIGDGIGSGWNANMLGDGLGTPSAQEHNGDGQLDKVQVFARPDGDGP